MATRSIESAEDHVGRSSEGTAGDRDEVGVAVTSKFLRWLRLKSGEAAIYWAVVGGLTLLAPYVASLLPVVGDYMVARLTFSIPTWALLSLALLVSGLTVLVIVLLIRLRQAQAAATYATSAANASPHGLGSAVSTTRDSGISFLGFKWNLTDRFFQTYAGVEDPDANTAKYSITGPFCSNCDMSLLRKRLGDYGYRYEIENPCKSCTHKNEDARLEIRRVDDLKREVYLEAQRRARRGELA